MIGRIIGGIVGAKLAKSEPGGMDGPGGALLGMGAAALARRFGPVGLIVGLAGGYALKRYSEKREKRRPARKARKATA